MDTAMTALEPMMRRPAERLRDRIKQRIGDLRADVLEFHDRLCWKTLGYETWEKCIQEEFDFDRTRAYQLMDAARFEKQLSTTVDIVSPIKESHVRPLKALPDEERTNVYLTAEEEAKASGKSLTARLIKAKVKERLAVLPPPEPAEAATEPVEEVEVIDAKGSPVHGSLGRDAFSRLSEAKEVLSHIRKADGRAVEIAADPILGSRFPMCRQQKKGAKPLPVVSLLLRKAKAMVADALPHSVCDACRGQGCEFCHERGWLLRTETGDEPVSPNRQKVLEKRGIDWSEMTNAEAARRVEAIAIEEKWPGSEVR